MSSPDLKRAERGCLEEPLPGNGALAVSAFAVSVTLLRMRDGSGSIPLKNY